MIAKKKRDNKKKRLRDVPPAIAPVEPLKETFPASGINKASETQKSKANNAPTKEVQNPANNKPSLRERMTKIKEWFKKQNTDTQISIVLAVFEFIGIAVAIGLLWQTGEQVTISRDTAKKQLRAYITVTDPYPDNLRFDDLDSRLNDTLEAAFTIVNSGQTPAYEVGDSSYIEICPKRSQLIMPSGTDKSEQFVSSSGTKKVREVKSTKPLSQQQISGIKDGSLGIFLWGRIIYKDIFGEYHWTEFCYQYQSIKGFYQYGSCNQAD